MTVEHELDWIEEEKLTEGEEEEELGEEEVEEFDSDSFSSVVHYPYNLPEVGWLVYKLYQLIERKFKLKQRSVTLHRLLHRWKDKIRKEGESGDRMKFRSDIENITRRQDMQLDLVKAKSGANKKRWKYLRGLAMTARAAQPNDEELGMWRHLYNTFIFLYIS